MGFGFSVKHTAPDLEVVGSPETLKTVTVIHCDITQKPQHKYSPLYRLRSRNA